MKRCLLLMLLMLVGRSGYSWGFYAHRLINYRAVFLLPPEMMTFFKPHILFLADHAVDPDKRRYAVEQEGPRHYIDLDTYEGRTIPQSWSKAVKIFSEDSLNRHGIVPWWIQVMLKRLTTAFREKDAGRILKVAAELGHYVADAHVPLHTSANHNGQLTNQHGIHGFWESRIPEMYAENGWDLIADHASYVRNPLEFAWRTVRESFGATDSVLKFEKRLDHMVSSDRKYAFEYRNGQLVKQYSTEYAYKYNQMLAGMIDRRMRQSINAVASLWYTAWINAGKPDLKKLGGIEVSDQDKLEFETIDKLWKNGSVKGRAC